MHNIYISRNVSLKCESDPVHIDWLTVTGATSCDLEVAWLEDSTAVSTEPFGFSSLLALITL